MLPKQLVTYNVRRYICTNIKMNTIIKLKGNEEKKLSVKLYVFECLKIWIIYLIHGEGVAENSTNNKNTWEVDKNFISVVNLPEVELIHRDGMATGEDDPNEVADIVEQMKSGCPQLKTLASFSSQAAPDTHGCRLTWRDSIMDHLIKYCNS